MENSKKNGALPLTSLNHISFKCRSLEKSIDFYKNVLGFYSIRRPSSFNFNGAWLLNHGIGVHLLQTDDLINLPDQNREINPKDNHISFQCESISAVEERLKDMNIKYVHCQVEEGGLYIDQLFFHDPDGFMVEICNCDILPVIPLGFGEPDETVSACKRGSLVKPEIMISNEPQSIACE